MGSHTPSKFKSFPSPKLLFSYCNAGSPWGTPAIALHAGDDALFYQTLQLSTQTCYKAKNCQYIFSAMLSCWGSWNSLKFSGIHLSIDTSSKHCFCYKCFHCTFHSKWDLFFLSEPSYPYYWSHSLVWHPFHHAAHHLFTNKIAAKIVGTSRIWVLLQQNLPTKRKTWFVCCRLYTFLSVLALPSYI